MLPADPSDRGPQLPASVAGYYRIVSKIGAGGMGLVYKAIDTRLNRAVAIKAIHGTRQTAGPTRRLRTEALAAASLDHPYICKIYELIEADDETLIVMEFVEGETLAAILKRGAPPIAQTLQLTSEIAEGLANAHERGLVHRDVKPSNVMVTQHGHVKLLDFGLAQPDVSGTPDADTRTSPDEGAAHGGTPQYMAPEQASGAPVTARADLFSLGVILFECLTGGLPFEGATGYDYARHLLSDAPRPLYRLAPHAPADLVKLVEQCLEKSPAKRPASAGAVVAELRRLAEAVSSPSLTLSTIRAARARQRWWAVAALGAVAVAVALAWRWSSPRGAEDLVRQSRPFITWPSEDSGSRLSPDGRWLSFLSTRGGSTQLFVQPTDGTEAKPVTLPTGSLVSHVWSPDGRDLACVLAQGDKVQLQIVPAFFGGVPRQSIPIVPAKRNIRLLRWIDRSVFLQVQDNSGYVLMRLDLDRAAIADVSGSWKVDGRLRGFDVRPDGGRVAFTMAIGLQEDLWTANLDGTSQERLTNDAFFERFPLWSGRGTTLIYQSNRGGPIDLWEMSPDTGRSWSLTSSQTAEVPDSTSGDGSLVSFEQSSENATLWTWDQAGKSRQLTADALADLSPSASGDGRIVAFQRSEPSPSQGYLILDSTILTGSLDGSTFQSDPRRAASGFAARLSPDGASLAFLQRSATPGRMTLQITNLQTNQTVTVSTTCPPPVLATWPVDWAEQNLAWNPAGTELYFVDQPDVHTLGRYRIGAAAPDPPIARLDTAGFIRDLHVTSDGRSIAYLTWSPKTYTLHIRDLDSGRDWTTTMSGGRNEVFLRGWTTGNTGVVLVRSIDAREDATVNMEVLVVAPGGEPRLAGVIDRSFIATTRLAPASSSLYVTRSADGVHNLYAFSLATDALTKITDNTLPGVTFSGVEPIGAGAVIGVRDERKRDVYLIDVRPAGSAKDAAGRAGR